MAKQKVDPRFKKIAFSCYAVKDLARSRQFYEGIVGLEPGDNFQDMWQEYDLNGTTFAITSMVLESVKPGTQASVAFEVADLEGVVKDLRSKGVSFASDDLMESPVCWMAFFKDPDGNSVSLHQAK
jgi:catechol 2,3-dioxygenase-like lactoylglutathione lyase family enzyme